ncbi:SAC3/GANP/Nin1/mts3/eIF-3 p25 family-domain-containing protein, partial [Phakopsora pachyrhizi]
MSLTGSSEELYKQLDRSFNPSNPTNHPSELLGELLTKLKLQLAQSSLLVPSFDDLNSINVDSLTKARHILEIGAFHSVRTHDIPAFERYISQLGPYYNDYKSILKPSQFRYPLIGLNLLRLLTQNKIAQFHTIIECLVKEQNQSSSTGQIEILHSNNFITHPINLERWLMEGSYSKVWLAREQVPIQEYHFFVDQLVDTIRSEIARCQEKAYSSLPLTDAGTLLFFKTPGEVLEFAQLVQFFFFFFFYKKCSIKQYDTLNS